MLFFLFPLLSIPLSFDLVEPPGGQGEMERSGGPHSDSGSISPTWERDRRGHMPGPPGPHGPPGMCTYQKCLVDVQDLSDRPDDDCTAEQNVTFNNYKCLFRLIQN